MSFLNLKISQTQRKVQSANNNYKIRLFALGETAISFNKTFLKKKPNLMQFRPLSFKNNFANIDNV